MWSTICYLLTCSCSSDLSFVTFPISLRLVKCCGSTSLCCGSGSCSSLWCGSRSGSGSYLSIWWGSGSVSYLSIWCGSGVGSYRSIWYGSGSGPYHVLFSRFGPSKMLQNDPLRLPSFHFDADPDPDPASHFDADADPDPASQNDVDPCGSGSETLVWSLLYYVGQQPLSRCSKWIYPFSLKNKSDWPFKRGIPFFGVKGTL